MRVLALCSGKGGVGKSTLACGIGIELARRGQRTLLFDGDLALANIDILLGIQPTHNLADVLAGSATLGESLAEGPFGLRVACGATAVAGLAQAGPAKLAHFRRHMAALEPQTDWLVIDTAGGLSPRALDFVRLSDEAVVVATPDVAAVADGYGFLKTLLRKPFAGRLHVLVNQVSDAGHGLRIYNALLGVAERYLTVTPNYLGAIRSDAVVATGARRRQCYSVLDANCPAAEDTAGVVSRLEAFPPARRESFNLRFAEELIAEATRREAKSAS